MGIVYSATSPIEIHSGDVATEFPDYPLNELPNLCQAWQDKSWHNDVCPSFVTRIEEGGRTFLAVLWCEYADRSIRELQDQARFAVAIYDVTDDEHRDAYYRGDEAFTGIGETINDLISNLTEDAAEVAHLVKENDEDMEGIRLLKAATYRVKQLMAASTKQSH